MKLLVNCRAHARGALLRVRRSLVRALALGFAFAIVARGTFGQAVSPIDFSDAPLADTRIGVAIAAMDELADAPALLARSSSQRFIDDAFARIAQTAPADVGLGAHLVRWRAALRVGERPFDREAAYAAVGELSKSLLRAVGSPRDKLIALGILAEQTSYNARVLRDPAVDGGDRAAIGANDAADGLVPGLRDLRERVATLGYKEWSDVADGAQIADHHSRRAGELSRRASVYGRCPAAGRALLARHRALRRRPSDDRCVSERNDGVRSRRAPAAVRVRQGAGRGCRAHDPGRARSGDD